MAKKPFHESILYSLYQVQNLDQLKILAHLIVNTEIPKEHRHAVVEGFLLTQQLIRYAGGEEIVELVLNLFKEEGWN